MGDDRTDRGPKRTDVFSLDSEDFDSVSFQGLSDVKAFQIFRRMAGDRNVIVIDEQLDVETLRDGQSGSFGVVSFLLRPV